MRRRTLGSILLAVGMLLVVLSIGTVAYARWREWQHDLQAPAGPREALPERLEAEAPGALHSGEGDSLGVAASPSPPGAAPARFELLVLDAPAHEPATPASPAAPPEPTATHGPTSEDLWRMTLERLDAVWGSDWPEAIALLEAFLARFPHHEAATDKLYAALVSYGQSLVEVGDVEQGVAQLERAGDLSPGRGEASAALRALTPTATPRPAGTPAPTPRPSYGLPVWMAIPRIGVNSSVVAVGAPRGEFQVPPFAVGYHSGSARPGDPGNSVFNGHLTTINAGRVFARLHELRPGDAVYVYTATHRLEWKVQSVRTHANTDASFILPTSDTRITLYTCAGRYNPVAGDYTHRLVVVGTLVRAVPRT